MMVPVTPPICMALLECKNGGEHHESWMAGIASFPKSAFCWSDQFQAPLDDSQDLEKLPKFNQFHKVQHTTHHGNPPKEKKKKEDTQSLRLFTIETEMATIFWKLVFGRVVVYI